MRASNGFGVLAVSFLLTSAAALIATGCSGYRSQPVVASPSEALGQSPEIVSPSIPVSPDSPDLESAFSSIDYHQQRYPLKDTHTKLVNDSGNGFTPLYGTRNFRAVLSGVVYRGGANNTYNKYGKRGNNNPLPNIGLENLCKEGFSTGVYLYSTNYASAPHTMDCARTSDGAKAHLDYKQFNPTTTAGQTAILDAVYRSIKDPSIGPVYLHCWNGWHASGLASAIVLRQFCGMSADTAVAYWDLNTDGAPVDSSYTSIRDRIRTFKVKAGYEISESIRKQICPH